MCELKLLPSQGDVRGARMHAGPHGLTPHTDEILTFMAYGPRVLFLLFIATNAILWSQGRFGSNQPSREFLGSHSIRSFAEAKECRPLDFPVPEQCAHVRKVCKVAPTFLSVKYLDLYFCSNEHTRPASFIGLLVWLLFLFSTLGISASDFFTPNLASISEILGLDENVAGVTFLAFGNGSPDVFSTFSAMKANSGSLAIGELIGAATFIVSCVVGAMVIIRPFRVHRGPFLRDVGFFSAAVIILLIILWDHTIQRWEAYLLVGLYLVYVTFVIVGSWWQRRQDRLREREALIRAEYGEDDPSTFLEETYRDNPTLTVPTSPTTRTRAISHPLPHRPRLQTDLPYLAGSRSPSPSGHRERVSQMPSFSIVGALEFRDVVASLKQQAAAPALGAFEQSPITPFPGGYYRRTPRSRSGSFPAINGHSNPAVRLSNRSPLYSRSPSTANMAASYFDLAMPRPQGRHDSIPSINVSHADSPEPSEADTDVQIFSAKTRWSAFVAILHRTRRILFPTMSRFRSKAITGKIVAVFVAPAVLALTLTLPVVVTIPESVREAPEKQFDDTSEGRLIEFEEEGIERALTAEDEVQAEMHEAGFNKWLMAVQCICGPLFSVAVVFGGSKNSLWVFIGAAILGTTTACLVGVFVDKGNHPTMKMLRCLVGFCVSVVWIMAIADEVVRVLQTFGFIFGLSDAIIGLTIFAVGNSLADLVANMSVAVFAPIMGFSACFGGPMLNILLGIGISGSYIISDRSQPYRLHFTSTLLVSTIGLLLLLLATVIFVPYNDYFLPRRWGVFLIASYSVIMTVSIIVEMCRL